MAQAKRKKAKKPASAETVFALDIGTHSIIGIVGVQKEDLFCVQAVCEIPHTTRTMIDGQIEDIEKVALIAQNVRDTLENELNIKLQNVCVAAAGRTLITQKGTWQVKLKTGAVIDDNIINELESAAVVQAFEQVLEKNSAYNTQFSCVGYSVINYRLDGYPINIVKGHKGSTLQVEIIATFLPQIVVDSLYTTMQTIGLTVESLTLEPIAAMNAVIPAELRILNLALVDIGAGTSDIAVSTGGSVSAYTMATIAGDELTEALANAFLIDFAAAEKIKQGPDRPGGTITFTDILGFEQTVTAADIKEKLSDTLNALADEIATRILDINGKAPAAVFLVGGGSKTPGLCECVAAKLGIDITKVAVGSNNYMKKMISSQADVSGPQFATPVGIALTASMLRSKNCIFVFVNNKKILLPNSRNYQIIDVLGYCGFVSGNIMERSGKSISVSVDGVERTFRGSAPIPADISINGHAAVLSSLVAAGDTIQICPAKRGLDACPTISEIVGKEKFFDITANGKKLTIGTLAFLNGQAVLPDLRVTHNCEICTKAFCSIFDIASFFGVAVDTLDFFVNDTLQDKSYILQPADILTWQAKAVAQPVEPKKDSDTDLPDILSNTDLLKADAAVQKPAEDIKIVFNGTPKLLPAKQDGSEYTFLDMFNFVNIDKNARQGTLISKLNGADSSYFDIVKNGDTVEIYWLDT